jgi:hypothetical protein
MLYSEVFSKLTYETAFLVFLKKDGTVRLMLGTRNLNTVSLQYGFQGKALGGHDNRCNIKNGNLAVFDLALGEARSFHIDRLVDIQYKGIITTSEELNKVAQEFLEFKEEYEKTKPMELDMSMLD